MTRIAADYTTTPLTELHDLSGQVAIVTGAARGIGAATAARLVEAGATVYEADLRASDKSGPHAGTAVTLDVTDPAAVTALFTRIFDKHGRIDILVNSAGVFPRARLLDLDLAQWRRVHAVNVEGALLCAQRAAQVMIAQQRGVIVNISSTVAHRVSHNAAHYRASKSALISLTQNLAFELGPRGIRALTVCPTLTLTEGVFALGVGGTTPELDKFAGRLPLGRAALPDDVARAVVFAVSPWAGYLTGSALYVDGGEMCL